MIQRFDEICMWSLFSLPTQSKCFDQMDQSRVTYEFSARHIRTLYVNSDIYVHCMLALDIYAHCMLALDICAHCMLALDICAHCMLALDICAHCMLALDMCAHCMLALDICAHCMLIMIYLFKMFL